MSPFAFGAQQRPVLRNGRVVGIVSARAPHVVVLDPYLVEMLTPLDEVVATMAQRRIGSAVVVKRDKLAGILSVTDVCRVLAEVLRERFDPPSGAGLGFEFERAGERVGLG